MDASWSVKPIWNLIVTSVHATPSINLIQESFSASIITIRHNATRESLCKIFYFFIKFLLNFWLSFDGESFQSVTSSEYSHSRTYGMGNYHGKALTTGCYGNQKCGVKTELMDMNTLTWSAGPDYPFIRDSYPFPK